jgi:hypothetical protein
VEVERIMTEFIYTTVPGKIKPLLNKIRDVGVPPKASIQWLKTLGFTSSNDGSLIGVLKFIGFTDSNSVPTSKWIKYRGADHAHVLGHAIRTGYSDLFKVYSDANQRSQADLEHVFSTNSSGGKQVISKMISTFKSLVEQAEFSAVDGQPSDPPDDPLPPLNIQRPPAGGRISLSPALHIDIQIHISPEASVDQVDQIFASMAKHLYPSRKAE